MERSTRAQHQLSQLEDGEWLRSESDRLVLRAWHILNRARRTARLAFERDTAARQLCDDARIAHLRRLWTSQDD